MTVVVTGVGMVTALGLGAEATWDGLIAGRSGVRTIAHFDASALPSRIAAWIPPDWIARAGERAGCSPDDSPRTVLATTAIREALEQAGLPVRLGRIACALWVGTRWERADLRTPLRCLAAATRDDGSVDPAAFVRYALHETAPQSLREAQPHFLTGRLAQRFGISGPAGTLQTACTSSHQALGEALNALRRGDADLALAGGADLTVTPFGLQFYAPLGVLSRHNACPQAASRPFDALRDGFVPGDGAAFLVLETRDHAAARGARPLAELAGYGTACDAYRITDEPPDGRGARLAMRRALDDAGIGPESVDYISAHATSTPLNDRVETLAIKAVFGDGAFRIPITGLKSMVGHTISAAGAISAIASVLAIARGVVPPTINQEVPDPDCDLDYVPNRARRTRVTTALVNGFGFGGHADCLVFRAIR